MAVAFDAFSQSHTETAVWSVSQASFSWSHNPVGVPRCAVVFVMQGISATDAVTSVTYAGAAMGAVTGGRATDTATEPGATKAYFLDNVPSNDPATVVVNRTNNTTQMVAVCITMTAAGACEIGPNITLVQNNATWAVQSIDDGSPGTNSLRLAATYTGASTFVPVGTGSTMAGQFNPSVAYSACACRETTAGQGARNVGFSSGTADDQATVALAVREVPPPVFVTDTFDRADSGTIGTDSLGNTWVERAGAWSISSNRVIQTDAGSVPGCLLCGTNMNNGNHWVEGIVGSGDDGTDQIGLLVRLDASVFTCLSFEVADGFYKLLEVSAGTPNTVFTGSAHEHTAGETYAAEVSGNTINFYLNGSLVATTTSSFNVGDTRVGFHINADVGTNTASWANFRAGSGVYPGPASAEEADAVTATATGTAPDATVVAVWPVLLLMAPMVAT